jgi:hypothetical protein
MMVNYRVTTLPALVAWVEPPTGGQYDGALRFAMGGASALRYGDAPDDRRRMGNATEFPCLTPPSASRTHHAHRRPIQSPLGGEAAPSGTLPLYPRCLLRFHGLGAQRGGKVCLYISRRTRSPIPEQRPMSEKLGPHQEFCSPNSVVSARKTMQLSRSHMQ